MGEFLSDMKLQVKGGFELLALEVFVGIAGRFDSDAREAWVETVVGEAEVNRKVDRRLINPLFMWRPEDRRSGLETIRTTLATKGIYYG